MSTSLIRNCKQPSTICTLAPPCLLRSYVRKILGVIIGDFFPIFAYEIVNIDVESTKIVTKMQIMNRITQKILKMKNFENFGQNWANFDKKCPFLQKCDLFKITFCDIT